MLRAASFAWQSRTELPNGGTGGEVTYPQYNALEPEDAESILFAIDRLPMLSAMLPCECALS